jgi:hypothetical protein
MDRIKAVLSDAPMTRPEVLKALSDIAPETLRRKIRAGIDQGKLIEFTHVDGQERVALKN